MENHTFFLLFFFFLPIFKYSSTWAIHWRVMKREIIKVDYRNIFKRQSYNNLVNKVVMIQRWYIYVFKDCAILTFTSLKPWLKFFILSLRNYYSNTVIRGHHWDKEKVVFKYMWPLKRGSIHRNFLWQNTKCDLLMRMIA